ncbi:MAG: glyoxalase/bleomycin resistance/extradiol dioxygenase family protein [Chitinophagaceae bacterium]|nr:glyoxalase/bleomycin resistance/extradiol dioxygenase family protein [Chitinophagaceae bacterium]MBN8668108.1 glyoxalase/bleomycin resistance/extradiol dioxygenase family protein [Chitinophagales bacterium]
MAKKIFINLPVTDLSKARDFYTRIGFTNNATFSDDTSACMVLSEEISVMLLTHEKFSTLTPKKIIDSQNSAGVINTLSLETLDDLHKMVDAAISAGGVEPHPFEDYGFMQHRGFHDLDGHLWGVVYVDMSKLPA